MKVLGVDGCRGGWVVVSLGGDGPSCEVITCFSEIVERDADLILVDMPIGLPEVGYRACDCEARNHLGKAAPRVFLGARRPLLQYADKDGFDAANKLGKSLGAGVSNQLHAIMGKIKEVDDVITPALQQRLRETHPEIIFWRLNACEPVPRKKTADGMARRRGLLEKHGFASLDDWIAKVRRFGAKPDDVLDACACALAAWHHMEGVGRTLPENGIETDLKSLRMEILY